MRIKLTRGSKKRNIIGASILLVLILGFSGLAWWSLQETGHIFTAKNAYHPPKPKPIEIPKPIPPASQPSFSKAQYSTTDPSSIWIVVNKQHKLNPVTYTPTDLTTFKGYSVSARIVPSLTSLFAAASTSGVNLVMNSGYRSYTYQQNLYAGYVSQDGVAGADRYSARAGYSEHQTGLAVDIGGKTKPSCNLESCFADTSEGQWLAANATKYGFIIRYTAANETVTGYMPEAWHLRFIGQDAVNQMHVENITTLEEFFGISGGETYTS